MDPELKLVKQYSSSGLAIVRLAPIERSSNGHEKNLFGKLSPLQEERCMERAGQIVSSIGATTCSMLAQESAARHVFSFSHPDTTLLAASSLWFMSQAAPREQDFLRELALTSNFRGKWEGKEGLMGLTLLTRNPEEFLYEKTLAQQTVSLINSLLQLGLPICAHRAPKYSVRLLEASKDPSFAASAVSGIKQVLLSHISPKQEQKATQESSASTQLWL